MLARRLLSLGLRRRPHAAFMSTADKGLYKLFMKHLERMGDKELDELSKAMGVGKGVSRTEAMHMIAKAGAKQQGTPQQSTKENGDAPSPLEVDANGNAILSTSWVKELTKSLSLHAAKGKKALGSSPIPKSVVMQVLKASQKHQSSLPSLLRLSIPRKTSLNVCGDTHGQFFDLLNIFSSNVASWPSSENRFLFNGDFVDRGIYSFEVAFTLLSMQLANPQSVHLLRGNHETTSMNRVYGFEAQVLAKYDSEVLEQFRKVFSSLPLAAVIEKNIFVVHGGIGPHTHKMNLDQIDALNRLRIDAAEERQGGVTKEEAEVEAMDEFLWADPQKQEKEQARKNFVLNHARGAGWCFSPDATASFLTQNNLSLLLRSHQLKAGGFNLDHEIATENKLYAPLRCITVFSAPNYVDSEGNLGALVRINRCDDGPSNVTDNLDQTSVQIVYGGRLKGIESDLDYSLVQFTAVIHPNAGDRTLKIVAQQQDWWRSRSR